MIAPSGYIIGYTSQKGEINYLLHEIWDINITPRHFVKLIIFKISQDFKKNPINLYWWETYRPHNYSPTLLENKSKNIENVVMNIWFWNVKRLVKMNMYVFV